jgi:exodeoxyribonuclease VII large subunit
MAAGRLGRPSALVGRQRLRLAHHAQRLHFAVLSRVGRLAQAQQALQAEMPLKLRAAFVRHHERLDRAALRLQLLDPALVLQRGYAWITNAEGQAVTSVQHLAPGEDVQARLADGTAEMKVLKTQTKGMRPTSRV